MKKYKLMVLIICVSLLLTACNQEAEEIEVPEVDRDGNEIVEYERPPLTSELRVIPELDGLVVMELEIDSGMLTETISNQSDIAIGTLSTSPILEYFDGTDWSAVPTTESFGFEDESIPLEPGGEHVFYYGLRAFAHRESGLFRLRRAVYLEIDRVVSDWVAHDVVFEFTLD